MEPNPYEAPQVAYAIAPRPARRSIGRWARVVLIAVGVSAAILGAVAAFTRFVYPG